MVAWVVQQNEVIKTKDVMAKEIVGFENYKATLDGDIINENGKVLKGHIDKDGYRQILLYNNKKRKYFRQHRLVLRAFCPIENEHLYQVNHIDGNKLNNKLSNLEWVTPSENIRHSFMMGMSSQTGSKNAMPKLTEEDVIKIREIYIKGDKNFGVCALARMFNVTHSVISRIVNGKGWTHVKD